MNHNSRPLTIEFRNVLRSVRSAATYGTILGLVIPCLTTAEGALLAGDVASNAAYVGETGGAWKGLNPTPDENPAGADDGGVGLTPWNFAGGYHYPQQSPYGRLNHFIDGVDFASSSFNNLGGPAFALTNANVPLGGATAVAARTFDSPLTAGSTLSLRFDNPSLAPLRQSDSSGLIIRLNSGGGPLAKPNTKERFAVFAVSDFQNGAWWATDSSGEKTIELSSNATTTGAEFRFTLTGSQSYQMEIRKLDGGLLASRSGNLANSGGGTIDTIELLMYGNGSGNGLTGGSAQPTGEREFFFNNLSITTEGATADYDGNGAVDGADFLHWQRSLGATSDLEADGNQNGVVDAGDLQVWKSANAQAGSSVPHTGAVPEAAASAVLVMPLFLAACHLRRRVF